MDRDQHTLRYIKGLDGIRALAVLIVILAHYGYVGCGRVGVQIFFVLSGFLITSLLLKNREQPLGRYLGRFYWRRVWRIFPIYFLYVAGLGLLFALRGIPKEFGHSWAWLVTFTFNWLRCESQQFTANLFSHLWSISVEEQFYLVWPFLIYFLGSRGSRKTALGIVLAEPAIRAAAGWILPHFGLGPGRWMYFGTVFQLDAFALGGLAAIAGVERVRKPAVLLAGAVIVALAAGGLGAWYTAARLHIPGRWSDFGYPTFMDYAGEYVWGYTAINLAAICLIICAHQRNVVARFLEMGPLVYLGRISYGIYLYHAAVFFVFSHLVPLKGRLVCALGFLPYLAAVVAVSHVSFFYFEKRFLALKNRRFAGAASGPPAEEGCDTAPVLHLKSEGGGAA